jgi:hypothetical protein
MVCGVVREGSAAQIESTTGKKSERGNGWKMMKGAGI